jgi:hypothetical protein
MGDEDGPQVTKFFYEKLFSKGQMSLDDIPYALDYAVGKLKETVSHPSDGRHSFRWEHNLTT